MSYFDVNIVQLHSRLHKCSHPNRCAGRKKQHAKTIFSEEVAAWILEQLEAVAGELNIA